MALYRQKIVSDQASSNIVLYLFCKLHWINTNQFRMNGANAENDAKRLKLFEEQIKFAKILAGNEFNVATKQKNINKLGELIQRRAEAGGK